MANGASFASLTSSTLNRSAKRGRTVTAGTELPVATGVIGAVEDARSTRTPSSPSIPATNLNPGKVLPNSPLSASDFDFLEKSSVTPPLDTDHTAASQPVQNLEPQGEIGEGEGSELVNEVVKDPSKKVAPADASQGRGEDSKLSHVPGSAFAGLSALAASREMPEPPKPKAYTDGASPFASLVKPGQSVADRTARRDVHAVKVVTRLVRAIAFKPGSDAQARVKSEALSKLLGDVHKAASAIAIAAAPLDAHRPWVHAMCSEAMADLVAAREERDTFGESLDMDAAIQAVSDLFESSETRPQIAEAIAGLSEAGYVEATSESIATDRVRASIGLAAWDLFDSVTDPRLGKDAFRYTYDNKPEEIVATLSEEAVRIAREGNIRASNLDLRTMHLQGSIRRVAALLGAEYVNRTRQIMNWIGEGESDAEYERRCAEAKSSLKTVVIPQVVELARRNFIAIEQIAPQLIEESKNAHANQRRENDK